MFCRLPVLLKSAQTLHLPTRKKGSFLKLNGHVIISGLWETWDWVAGGGGRVFEGGGMLTAPNAMSLTEP